LSTALALLQVEKLSPEAARPHYEMMQRQVQHMARLIDDLMEVSRITRGKIKLKPEVLALERVVADAVELSRPLLNGSRHQLELVLPDESLKVRGDRVRLTQVFSNLLNNAAKYTPAGGRVVATVERHDGVARVGVRDNGMGIPSDMLGSIFEMFVQVTETSSAAQGGLGIGLTLAKSLVELHGGTVSAFSAGAGRGSELVVTLPLLGAAETAGAGSVEDAKYDRISGHILIVDDNREAAESLSVLLEAFGAKTSVAYDGEEALAIAATVHPSVGILDIGMPGMDGCELARRLRADRELAGIYLVALTGWGQKDDRARVGAAGFDHHLLKPLDIAELRALLQARKQAA
jgi:CheY-like chemotaxis protein